MIIGDNTDPEFQNFLYKLQINTANNKAARSEKTVELHASWIHEKLLSKKNSRILDVGCGIGLYSIALSKLGHSVCGVDISPQMINHAKRLCQNCEFIISDILKLELHKKFDLIIFTYSTFNFFSSTQRNKFLKKMYSFLNPDGIFYFESIRFMPHEMQSKVFIFEKDDNDFLQSNKNVSLIINDQVWQPNRKKMNLYYYYVLQNKNVKKDKISMYYYSHNEYKYLLIKAGFNQIEFPIVPINRANSDNIPYESILAFK